MSRKITKISDTQLRIEEEPEVSVMEKIHIEERILHFQNLILEYKDMLQIFD